MKSLILTLLMTPVLLLGQNRYSVHGLILDAKTGKSIEHANVFLANTTRGTTSDAGGFYSIQNIPPGRYDLIIGMMGYETARRQIKLELKDLKMPTIWIEPKAIMGETIVITAEKPKHWKRRLERFKEAFLGYSPRAVACRIINETSLNFDESEGGILTATCNEVLEVENPTLGYTLKVHLYSFTANPMTGLFWEADVQFIESQAETPEQQAQWIQARNETFKGSIAHFLRSLAANRIKENGFEIHRLNGLPWRDSNILRYPMQQDSLAHPGLAPHEVNAELPEFIQVTYKNMKEPEFYSKIRRSLRNRQGEHSMAGPRSKVIYPISYIHVIAHPLTINRQGFIYLPHLMTNYGYWAYERIPDILPLDFEPDA